MKRRDLLRYGLGTAAAMAVGTFPSLSHAAAPTRRIKIGMLGSTHAHAAGKLATVRRLTDWFELVGVVEPDAQRRQKLNDLKDYAGVPWMSSEQLLNTAGLKAVLVETSVPDLVPTATRCAAANLHIHLDKPAGTSLSEFAKLLDMMKSAGRHLQMGYMFRYNPAFSL